MYQLPNKLLSKKLTYLTGICKSGNNCFSYQVNVAKKVAFLTQVDCEKNLSLYFVHRVNAKKRTLATFCISSDPFACPKG